MQLYLEQPVFAWLALGFAPLLIWIAVKSYAIAPTAKRVASVGLRFVALALIVLALTRPVVRMQRPDESVVFALDVSDSLEKAALEDAVAHLQDASKQLSTHQKAALVLFGARARVERGLASEPISIDARLRGLIFHRSAKAEAKARQLEIERDLSSDGAEQRLRETRAEIARIEQTEKELGTSETDIREALRLSRSLLPEDSRRRIVLESDGNWTRSDPETELAFLKRAGIEVDTKAVHRNKTGDVVVERIIVPSQVKIREPVELEVHISSAKATKATLELQRDGFLLKTEEIQLHEGRNVIHVPKQELREGFHRFKIKVQVAGDPEIENNIARAVVVVTGRPKVLLIERKEADARYLEQALHDEDIRVEVRPPLGFPEELNELLDFDVVILSDVPATDLHSRQLAMIKRYVKDYGGGLIMLGGEKSFGLGGYYRTPVEDALPVRMPIKKTIEKPNLALVLVLDRSGSMTGEKIALAKEAAIASVEVLKKRDEIGVVVFDSAPDWVVELQPASQRDAIVTQISRVVAGGGTYIYGGLYRAYEALTESTAKLKHVIVLTDGHTQGTREEHLDIVSRMSAEQITVSTVGIGDADQALLTAMAEAGRGEAYFTNDFGSIPQIFTKETLRASKSMLVEEPFVPTVVRAREPMLEGVEMADAPLLLGYVSTTPKETARLVLVSDYGDPILAHWNYGLGRAVAFTSDAKNHWASDWVSWAHYGKFWGQVVRSVMATGTTKQLQQSADIRLQRGEVKVVLDTRDTRGGFLDLVRPEVAILDAAGKAEVVATRHVAPGLYEAHFPLRVFGDFLRLRVKSFSQSKLVGLANYALVESYPPEYRAAAPDLAFMQHASRVTGGRFGAGPMTAFSFGGEQAFGLTDLWRLCVLLAGLLLPLDIALRRLG